jgi:hypothetical protein
MYTVREGCHTEILSHNSFINVCCFYDKYRLCCFLVGQMILKGIMPIASSLNMIIYTLSKVGMLHDVHIFL